MNMKISRRCSGVSPSMTLAITSKAKALKAQGLDVMSFGAGEPDFNTPKHICDAAKEALDKGITKYTPAAGTIQLRKAIVQSFKNKNLEYEPTQIVVSNGAKHSLHNAIATIVEVGDEVLLPTPYWVSYPEQVKLAGGSIVGVKCDENFVIDTADMEKKISSKTRALIINNPCNPTGAVYRDEQLKEIAGLCIEHDIYVISDEIYDELIYEGERPPSIATYEGMKERTIVINGVSKAYAMTGWRIGYSASPPNVAKAISSLQSQTTSNPNSIAQYASIAALNGPQDDIAIMKKAFRQRRDYAVEKINSIKGLSCPTPEGAFYIMMDVSSTYSKSYKGKKIDSSMDFATVLLDEKLTAVVPGIAFDADNCVRLSYAASMDTIKEGLKRIEEFVGDIK